MVAMPAMDAAPAVDHDVGPIRANHTDHFAENRVAPNLFRFLGRFRKAKVRRASKEKFYAVAARGREKFLSTDQTELRRLLRPQIILPAFAARERQQSNICMEAAGQISEQSG